MVQIETINRDFIIDFRNNVSKLATKTLKSKIHNFSVKFETNNDLFYKFWNKNWFKSNEKHEIMIYAIQNEETPCVYANLELKTLIISNATYYGHIKTLTLEFLRELNLKKNILSIHGSCADIDNKGLIFLGKSGMGKSTLAQIFTRTFHAKSVSDDWLFIDLKKEELFANNPEKYFYIRTSILRTFPDLEEVIRNAMLENANKDLHFDRFVSKKYRLLIDPKEISNNGVKRKTKINTIFLLRKNYDDITLVHKINEFEAIEKLKKNNYLYPNLIQSENIKLLNKMFLDFLSKTEIFMINFIRDAKYFFEIFQKIIDNPTQEHVLTL